MPTSVQLKVNKDKVRRYRGNILYDKTVRTIITALAHVPKWANAVMLYLLAIKNTSFLVYVKINVIF